MSLTIVLFDNSKWRMHLLPLCATRPVGNLRVGILTLNEKWEKIFNAKVVYQTADYLSSEYPKLQSEILKESQGKINNSEFLVIKANVLPSERLIAELKELKEGELLIEGENWIGFKTNSSDTLTESRIEKMLPVKSNAAALFINFPQDIFLQNKSQLLFDFNLICRGRTSAPISTTNMVFGDWIFIEPGAQVQGVCLNSLEGPIYIGKDAVVEEGSFLRGYTAVGERSRVKMCSRIYPNVSIGPGSTVAGEMNNTVIWGNSAKGHDGYLGCSVIGEGCNLGAGTTNSNLKNNWSSVRLFDYGIENYRDTQELKCGLIMGDFSMCGINSSFTTGTVIGVATQIAISKFIPKFVADFTWMTDAGQRTYNFEKFEKMMENRAKSGAILSRIGIPTFRYIFEQTSSLRGK